MNKIPNITNTFFLYTYAKIYSVKKFTTFLHVYEINISILHIKKNKQKYQCGTYVAKGLYFNFMDIVHFFCIG